MPLATRTFDESYQLARSLLRNYIDDSDVSEGSDYDITARILAGLFIGNQGQAEFLGDQIFSGSSRPRRFNPWVLFSGPCSPCPCRS